MTRENTIGQRFSNDEQFGGLCYIHGPGGIRPPTTYFPMTMSGQGPPSDGAQGEKACRNGSRQRS